MYEEDCGVYFFVEEVVRVFIYEMGYKGYVFMELFLRIMVDEGKYVLDEYVQRGIMVWRKLLERLLF